MSSSNDDRHRRRQPQAQKRTKAKGIKGGGKINKDQQESRVREERGGRGACLWRSYRLVPLGCCFLGRNVLLESPNSLSFNTLAIFFFSACRNKGIECGK